MDHITSQNRLQQFNGGEASKNCMLAHVNSLALICDNSSLTVLDVLLEQMVIIKGV